MAKNFVSNKDESARMFKSDFLEGFSKIHWSVPLFIFVPVILFFLYRSVIEYQIFAGSILLYFIFGVFNWTFTEYFLHRFLFHLHPTSDFGRRINFMFHGVHHDYPQDSKRLVMVPIVSIPLATLFYFLFYYLIGPIMVAPFFAGFMAGYLGYDMIHYATHHFAFKNKLFLWLKQYHMRHHYMNPEKAFGVSSPIWDIVFRTEIPKKEPAME
jgi:sterol desaturase/sphingolipid hydroxylase (fatty acid hydroxylase superfamily)